MVYCREIKESAVKAAWGLMGSTKVRGASGAIERTRSELEEERERHVILREERTWNGRRGDVEMEFELVEMRCPVPFRQNLVLTERANRCVSSSKIILQHSFSSKRTAFSPLPSPYSPYQPSTSNPALRRRSRPSSRASTRHAAPENASILRIAHPLHGPEPARVHMRRPVVVWARRAMWAWLAGFRGAWAGRTGG